MSEASEATRWVAGIWDHPTNGTRYCVRRPDSRLWGGVDVAIDERGGVLTFGTREEAEQRARKLNGDRTHA